MMYVSKINLFSFFQAWITKPDERRENWKRMLHHLILAVQITYV